MLEVPTELEPTLAATRFLLARNFTDLRYFVTAPEHSRDAVIVAVKRIMRPELPFWSLQTRAKRPLIEIEWRPFSLATRRPLRLVDAVGRHVATIELGGNVWALRDAGGAEIATARRRGTPVPLRLLLNNLYLSLVPLPFSFELSRGGSRIGVFRRRVRFRHRYALELELAAPLEYRLELLAFAVAAAELEQAGSAG